MIEVRIPEEDYKLHAKHHVVLGNMVLNSLRAAGIPAVGILALEGVKRGELTLFRMVDPDDLDGAQLYCYRWRDLEDVDNKPLTFETNSRGHQIVKAGKHAEDDEL